MKNVDEYKYLGRTEQNLSFITPWYKYTACRITFI